MLPMTGPSSALTPQLAPPEQWRLLGEGGANWVFAWDGDTPQLAGRVLRVRKPCSPVPLEQSELEAAVWAPALGSDVTAAAHDGAAAAAAAAAREQRYVERMLAPLLGEQHVARAQPVAVDAAYLQAVLAANGCKAAAGNSGGAPGPAALLPDATLLPDSSSGSSSGTGMDAGPVVCLELKPKCGFVGDCATVHPANRGLKRHRSRYQLHQQLKLAEGKIDACSAYDPCDLFSGDAARVRTALAALVQHPQNNLRLFVGGRPAELAQPAGSADGQQPEQAAAGQQQQQQQPCSGQQLRAAAAGWDALLGGLLPQVPAAQRQPALVEVLAAVLEAEGVLPRLLQAQQQCPYDIEGVFQLFQRLAAAPAAAGCSAAAGAAATPIAAHEPSSSSGSNADDHAVAVRRLLALPQAEAHAALRSYVVSATAKDCAVMLALQGQPCSSGDDGGVRECSHDAAALRARVLQPQHGNAPGSLRLHSSSGSAGGDSSGAAVLRYRLTFVDLDLKALAKIPGHHALDQRILAAARAAGRKPGGGGASSSEAGGGVAAAAKGGTAVAEDSAAGM